MELNVVGGGLAGLTAAIAGAERGAEHLGAEAARAVGNMMGVVLFHAEPARLSAAFVWDRFQRVATPGWPAPCWGTTLCVGRAGAP